MEIGETERLRVRKLTVETADLQFINKLLNEPKFLENIGDKGVRTEEDAKRYLENGPLQSYATHGFGLYLVSVKEGEPIGICGLLQRAELPAPDLGYALLREYEGKGYAMEACSFILSYERSLRPLPRLLAIVSPHNLPSIRLLSKLSFQFVSSKTSFLSLPDNPSDPTLLYSLSFPSQ